MQIPLRSALEGVKSPSYRSRSVSNRELEPAMPRIVVAGIGGGGNNTVDRIASSGISGVEMAAINTDRAHLSRIKADKKVPIGGEITGGRGTGGYPEVGRRAAKNAIDRFREIFRSADLVFLAYSLGGGTGTGAGPIAAQVAKEEGAVVTGIITMPFDAEKRDNIARDGLEELCKFADSVIVIENDRLSDLAAGFPMRYALAMADQTLTHMLKGITETIMYPSLINLDFADVKAIMEDGQIMLVGIGESDGESRAEKALEQALECPLLGDVDYSTSRGIIIHISGSNVTISEAGWIGERVQEQVHYQAQVIWGARVEPGLGNTLRVILLISGASSPHLLDTSSRDEVKTYGGPGRKMAQASPSLGLPFI